MSLQNSIGRLSSTNTVSSADEFVMIDENNVLKKAPSNVADVSTTRIGSLQMQDNATPTVISVAGFPQAVAGTTVAGPSISQFTMTGDSTLRYDGDKTFNALIMVSVSVRNTAVATDNITFFFYKNFAVINNVEMSTKAEVGLNNSVSMFYTENLQNGDIINVRVANDDNANDLIISDLLLEIR